jgi:hypothetical protein
MEVFTFRNRLATTPGEAFRIVGEAGEEPKNYKSSTFKVGRGAGRVAQVVEYLTSKHETLSSSPNITKTRGKKKCWGRE